jgi:hypothetical protein
MSSKETEVKKINNMDEYYCSVFDDRIKKKNFFNTVWVMILFSFRHLLLEYKKRCCSHFWGCVVFVYVNFNICLYRLMFVCIVLVVGISFNFLIPEIILGFSEVC